MAARSWDLSDVFKQETAARSREISAELDQEQSAEKADPKGDGEKKLH